MAMKSQSCVKLHRTRENLLLPSSCPRWIIKTSFVWQNILLLTFFLSERTSTRSHVNSHHSGSSFNSIASTCILSAEMLGSFRPCGWENSVSCHMLHLSAANALKKALASTFSGSGSLRSLGDATFWKAPGKTTQWVTQHFKRNFQRTECLNSILDWTNVLGFPLQQGHP